MAKWIQKYNESGVKTFLLWLYVLFRVTLHIASRTSDLWRMLKEGHFNIYINMG